LGLTSLAASIRQSIHLGRENRKLNSVGEQNKGLGFAINDVLLPMLSYDAPQSLAKKIIEVTGGSITKAEKVSETDLLLDFCETNGGKFNYDTTTEMLSAKAIMTKDEKQSLQAACLNQGDIDAIEKLFRHFAAVDELHQRILPAILTEDDFGAELGKLLYANTAITNPLEFVAVLFQNSKAKWVLADKNIVGAWETERAQNLLVEMQITSEKCDEYDVEGLTRALDLAEQAQGEQENPEIQDTITVLRAKIAQLNSASNYTIEVPVDKWNAIFLGIWRSLSLSDKELVSAIPANDKYNLAVKLTNAQRGRLTRALQKYEDMTITRLSSGDIHGRN